MASIPPVRTVTRQSWRAGALSSGERIIPEETAIALTYNRNSYAVMMGTPADLEDFAVGFSLAESVVAAPDEILELETVQVDHGIELRMWITEARIDALS